MSLSLKVLTLFIFSKGATNATIAAAGGNDSVVAALTLASSSIESADGDDSLSIPYSAAAPFPQVLVQTASRLPKVFPQRFTPTRETTSSLLQVMQPPPLLLVVKEQIPSASVATSPVVKFLVTLVQTASLLPELPTAALVHGGAGNDSMTVGAIVGGTAGGGLGADSLVVNGKVTGCRTADEQQV